MLKQPEKNQRVGAEHHPTQKANTEPRAPLNSPLEELQKADPIFTELQKQLGLVPVARTGDYSFPLVETSVPARMLFQEIIKNAGFDIKAINELKNGVEDAEEAIDEAIERYGFWDRFLKKTTILNLSCMSMTR